MASTLTLAPYPINFSDDPIMITVTSGVSTEEDNLTCSVVVRDTITAAPADFIVKLTPTYDSAGQMTCNLSSLFDLVPPLPAAGGTGSGTHYGSYRKYAITHGDRYGIPPTEDGINTSETFAVIRGSSPKLKGFGSTSAAWYLMHSYKIIDHTQHVPVVKVVSATQPEPIYFYAPAGTSVGWAATVTYLDGTTDYVTGSFALVIGLTHHHLNLSQIAPGGGVDDVISYDLEISGSGYTRTIRYIVDRHPNDYERILLYENGCGGMETLRMAGRHERGHTVDRQVSSSTVWSGYNHKDGQYRTTSANGGETLQLSTGYYTRSYIQHLEQILYGDVWLYDREILRLERYTVQQSSLSIHRDTDQKYALSLTISPAHDSASANTWDL